MAPALAYDPVPDWLRETRLRQRRPDGKAWTQDDLLNRMRAEIGWAPHRPNYSKYESGKAKPETVLPRFIEFWAKLGEPGPDYTEPETTQPADPLATALLALADELRGLREERLETAAQVAALRGVVFLLAQRSGVERSELDALLA